MIQFYFIHTTSHQQRAVNVTVLLVPSNTFISMILSFSFRHWYDTWTGLLLGVASCIGGFWLELWLVQCHQLILMALTSLLSTVWHQSIGCIAGGRHSLVIISCPFSEFNSLPAEWRVKPHTDCLKGRVCWSYSVGAVSLLRNFRTKSTIITAATPMIKIMSIPITPATIFTLLHSTSEHVQQVMSVKENCLCL